MKPILRLLAATALMGLSACAEVPTDPDERAAFEANNDPLEPMNRAIFDFNMKLDRNIVKPVAIGYRDALPGAVKDGIRNFSDNLGEPIIFVNEVLEFRAEDAATTVGRFFLNTILGLGGLFDVAGPAKIQKQEADFGQTLYVWGVHDGGPYLVLPFINLGSNPRDTVGSIFDAVADPIGLAANNNGAIGYSIGVSALSLIDLRARHLEDMDELEKSSLDFYAKLRSIARQRRNAQLGVKEQAEDQALIDPDSSK